MKFDLNTIVVSILSSVVASVATISVSTFDYFNRNRELDIRMVDVALTILSAKDDGTKSMHAKQYALKLLSNYGGVTISTDDQLAWAADGTLVAGNWPMAVADAMNGVKIGSNFSAVEGWASGRSVSREYDAAIRRIFNEELDKRFSGKGIVNPEQ